MNIKFDVDATPEELRRFFGLPDVHPLQQEMLDKIREKMLAGMDGFDPATLMKPFLPESMHSLEAPSNRVAWYVRLEADVPTWPDVDLWFRFDVLPSGEAGGGSHG